MNTYKVKIRKILENELILEAKNKQEAVEETINLLDIGEPLIFENIEDEKQYFEIKAEKTLDINNVIERLITMLDTNENVKENTKENNNFIEEISPDFAENIVFLDGGVDVNDVVKTDKSYNENYKNKGKNNKPKTIKCNANDYTNVVRLDSKKYKSKHKNCNQKSDVSNENFDTKTNKKSEKIFEKSNQKSSQNKVRIKNNSIQKNNKNNVKFIAKTNVENDKNVVKTNEKNHKGNAQNYIKIDKKFKRKIAKNHNKFNRKSYKNHTRLNKNFTRFNNQKEYEKYKDLLLKLLGNIDNNCQIMLTLEEN